MEHNTVYFNRNVNRLFYLLAAHGTQDCPLQLEQELDSVGTRPNWLKRQKLTIFAVVDFKATVLYAYAVQYTVVVSKS